MGEQIDFFQSVIPLKIGTITEDRCVLGKELTWEELEEYNPNGRAVWLERKGESYLYWELIDPEAFFDDYYFKGDKKTPTRKCRYFDGKSRGWFAKYWGYKFYSLHY